MYRYIKAMSTEREGALKDAASYATILRTHIIKIVVYHDILSKDVPHWISEIATWLSKVDKIKIKPNNRRLKPSELQRTLFSSLGDELDDYDRYIDIFQVNLMQSSPSRQDSYPEFKNTSQLAEELMHVCNEFIKTVTPMICDKIEHDKQEYVQVLNNIFKEYI